MDNTDPYKTKFKEERLYMSTNQNLRQHMRELIDRIKAADVAYYRDDNPTMTDREYDLLVDELKELETTTGLILSGSPTQTVPGEILKELMPVRHTKPMLSADKTKSVDEMLRFANGRPVVLSWKLDGLTIVLRYEGGEFKQAITRGREGIIGEDVTHTVRTFMNVPMCIPCTDKFEVRGEGVISWAHFEKISLSLSEPYSHPRNLAAGSVRMLDARESGKRYLEFFAFDLISDSIEEQSKTAQLQFLAENGFDVVPYVYTDAHDADELRKLIADFKPAEYGYPVDGVIVEYPAHRGASNRLADGDRRPVFISTGRQNSGRVHTGGFAPSAGSRHLGYGSALSAQGKEPSRSLHIGRKPCRLEDSRALEKNTQRSYF